jgi:hypothetical protein
MEKDDLLRHRSALGDILYVYKQAGFRVTTICCDKAFRGLASYLKDVWQKKLNIANAQEHVAEIERSHRVIKGRARAMFHLLPYQSLPKTALQILVMESAKK